MPPTPSLRLTISVTHTRATILSYSTTRLSKLKPSTPLSLNHFLQRQRVLSLWRRILRATYKIPSPDTRKEMRDYARREFERNRGIEDMRHVRYLMSMGKAEFDRMERFAQGL